jgi:hypothetical protein
VPAQPEMTGKSLLGLLTSRGPAPAHRDHLLTGKERHAWVRQGGLGYPCRALRTDDYLYIRNFKPERWPAGDPEPGGDNDRTFGDIDDGPTKSFMRGSPDPQVRRLWVLAVAKRPAEELYDLNSDPDELINLADDPVLPKPSNASQSGSCGSSQPREILAPPGEATSGTVFSITAGQEARDEHWTKRRTGDQHPASVRYRSDPGARRLRAGRPGPCRRCALQR